MMLHDRREEKVIFRNKRITAAHSERASIIDEYVPELSGCPLERYQLNYNKAIHSISDIIRPVLIAPKLLI